MNATPHTPITTPVTASELAGAMERLTDALARENEALREHRRDELTALVREKVAAGRIYEAQLKSIAADGGVLHGATDALRQRLAGLARTMAELAAENHRRLKVAVEVNRRIAETITDAVKAMTPGPGVYSRQGAIDRGRPSGAGAPMAFSLDRTL